MHRTQARLAHTLILLALLVVAGLSAARIPRAAAAPGGWLAARADFGPDDLGWISASGPGAQSVLAAPGERYWNAPSGFLGDRSALLDGLLALELRLSDGAAWTPGGPDVVLEGGDFVLGASLEYPPSRGVTGNVLRLDETAGWVDTSTLGPASREQMASVLADLRGLRVRGANGGTFGAIALARAPAPQAGSHTHLVVKPTTLKWVLDQGDIKTKTLAVNNISRRDLIIAHIPPSGVNTFPTDPMGDVVIAPNRSISVKVTYGSGPPGEEVNAHVVYSATVQNGKDPPPVERVAVTYSGFTRRVKVNLAGRWTGQDNTPFQWKRVGSNQADEYHVTWVGAPGTGHDTLRGSMHGHFDGSDFTGPFLVTEKPNVRVTGDATFHYSTDGTTETLDGHLGGASYKMHRRKPQ